MSNLTPEQYFQRFYISLTRRNYSKDTLALYRHCTDKFFDYLTNHTNTDLRSVTRQTIMDYWQYLKDYRNEDDRPYSEATIHSSIKSLRQFFKYLKKQDIILLDPTQGLPIMHAQKNIPGNIMTKEEVKNILDRPDPDTLLGFRDRAILETLYSTGIRRTELTNLTIYDVDITAGLVRIIQGKGKKDRVVPIGKVALNYVKEYLAMVRPKLQKRSDVKALFLNRYGQALRPANVNLIVIKYTKKANIKKRIGPHAFRHTCATEMLKGGSSVRHVQAMLGHAHIKTTQIYTRVVPLDLKKMHQKTHPREWLKKKEIIPFNCGEEIKYKTISRKKGLLRKK